MDSIVQQSCEAVVGDILKYVLRDSAPLSRWRVGTTLPQIPSPIGTEIVRFCETANEARQAKRFLQQQGLRGEGDDTLESLFVVASLSKEMAGTSLHLLVQSD